MNAHLEELLLDWEQRRELGEASAVETLRMADPTDQAELQRRARMLEACDRLLFGPETAGERPAKPEVLPERIGPYEIRGELGRGGMGVVYAGWDPILQRGVALKVLRPLAPWASTQERERLARRFEQEAQVLAQLKHPHIVPVYAATVSDGNTTLVMEQVTGGSLEQHRERLASAGPDAVAAFLEKVCRAVHRAHESGVLHRDLKPGNILLDEAGEPRVSDFGLAKLSTEAEPENVPNGKPASDKPTAWDAFTAMTLPGQQAGTPAYMAPEQFDPLLGRVGRGTDVWALGVVLYELLTGVKPFRGKTWMELSAAVREARPVPPRQLQPRLPRRLEAIALRCLAREPGARYPTAAALAEALLRFRSRRRRMGQRLAAALGVAAVGLGLAAVLAPRHRPEPPAVRAAELVEDKYALFKARTAPLQERLRRGEEVELIPSAANDRSPVLYYPRDASVSALQTPDGLRVGGPGWGNFLELLPAVPLTDYRITARVRFESMLAQDCHWGIYYTYDEEPSACGLQVFHHSLLVEEERPLVKNVSTGGNEWVYHVSLSPHLFANLQPPATRLYRFVYLIRPNVKDFITRKPHPVPVNEGWRTLVIDVGPAGAKARITDPDGELQLTPYQATSDSDFLKTLRRDFDDVALIPWFPRKNSAAGIYLKGSVCTVGSFKIQALPAAPAP